MTDHRHDRVGQPDGAASGNVPQVCHCQAAPAMKMIPRPEYWASCPPATAPDLGYTYLLAFQNGMSKVGSTQDPKRRVSELIREAWTYRVVLKDMWLSVLHPFYRWSEKKLIQRASEIVRPVRNEYFYDIPYVRLWRIADAAVGDALAHGHKSKHWVRHYAENYYLPSEQPLLPRVRTGIRVEVDYDERNLLTVLGPTVTSRTIEAARRLLAKEAGR